MTNITRKTSILILILFLLIGLSGTLIYRLSSSQKTKTDQETQAVKVELIESALPKTSDIALATDSRSQTLLAQLYEGLYVFTSGTSVRRGLAQDMSVSKDRLTYTIQLKQTKNAQGQPITAQDFVDSFRRVAANKTNSPYGFLFEVFENGRAVNDGKMKPERLGVKAKGRDQLVITLNQPVSNLKELLAMSVFYPQPESKKWQDLTGNGAFTLEQMSKNGYTLKKNNQYHQQNVVTVEEVKSRIISDHQTQWSTYENSKAAILPLQESVETQEDQVSRPTYQKKRSGVFYIAFNQKNEAFREKTLRKRIAHALMEKESVRLPLGYAGIPTNRFVVTDTNVLMSEPVQVKKENGKQQKKQRIEMLNFEDPQAKRIGQQLETYLERQLPDIDIVLKPVAIEEKIDKEQSAQYAMTLTGWMPDYPGPLAYLNQFVSDNPLNSVNYQSDTYDQIIEKARQVREMKKKQALYHQAERQLIHQDAVIVPLYQTTEKLYVSDTIQGIEVPIYGPEYLLRAMKILK
ncbi:peptide ABC transporter substrate-binding protein [Exiguobacterium sp. TBG-PICH-001]|uniref:peptide ABC transporter substrate-binding protein n=1 Tax=Exiguobacterium abrahamii TaxID=2785532 RepID=UPI0018A74499|nr:peptide ABC transporter substrate-binding protein [Exiguobacterium sp. TBG-PICH-001]MBF8152366.1 peptide ABC transporter substrate-binding protein [Exiguobacterium sp. TBG-PICH-001]